MFGGTRTIHRLDRPIPTSAGLARHVVASTITFPAMSETLIFPCDRDGLPLTFGEVARGRLPRDAWREFFDLYGVAHSEVSA